MDPVGLGSGLVGGMMTTGWMIYIVAVVLVLVIACVFFRENPN
ncbi:hypothetical protein UFOVP1196_9 [uncultured Caudovirales phage]|uniref:Uncharacterized protein n=1 Tax=uncultured Caudovirales phage TaxID=2100421 RepID=A0A6J5R4U0_9CAUD|nr:hypothetical protein UFOVP1196_9 [uncultured Caudovirales phage]